MKAVNGEVRVLPTNRGEAIGLINCPARLDVRIPLPRPVALAYAADPVWQLKGERDIQDTGIAAFYILYRLCPEQ
jgi:hypothetical protein